MNQATATIRTAAELHKYLRDKKHFDFNPDSGRDAELYTELKRSLLLPEGAFLKALSAQSLTAEQYLRALMTAAQPLSEMYKEILEYCKRANFLRSKQGVKIEWEIASGDETIGFSFETFRIFDEVKASLEPPSRDLMFKTKNRVMHWLAHDVFAPDHQGLPNKQLNWTDVAVFNILAEARDRYGADYAGIFRGLNNFYLGGTGSRPSAKLRSLVTSHSEYPEMLSEVAKAFKPDPIELIASKFIALPFWKFRWQIYEIWVITVSLFEFEKLGFGLVANRDGCSLIEQGTTATLGTHMGSQPSFIYQPKYLNRSNAEMRPDIVISTTPKATSDSVRLIIECKQRIKLDMQHVEQVREKYEGGVNALDGEVVMVNYDEAPSWSNPNASNTLLIGNVRPNSGGEIEFRKILRTSRIAKSLRKEAWFIDISLSMSDIIDEEFRQQLAQRMEFAQSDSIRLYGFAQEVKEMLPSELQGNVAMSSSKDDLNWEGHGINQLYDKVRELLKVESMRVFIVSDIADKIKDFRTIANDHSYRVRFINPSADQVLDLLDH